MAYSQDVKGKILRRSKVFGIPKTVALPFAQLVAGYEKNNGPEWTVSRVKDVKQVIIDYLAGKGSSRPAWFRHDNNTILGGHFRPLMKYALNSRGNSFKAINLLQAYTLYRSPRVTVKQWLKFYGGVKSSPLPDYTRSSMIALRGLVKSNLGLQPELRISDIPCCLSVVPSESRRCPTTKGSKPEVEGYLDSVLSPLVINSYGLHFYRKYDKMIDRVLKGIGFDSILGQMLESEPSRESFVSKDISIPFFAANKYTRVFGGSIGFIQEAGYKLRSVANPSRLHQLVLQPLGDALFSLLRHLPWDCTFDQSKPLDALQASLKAGKTVHSVDLSSATDLFPLEVQMAVLERLFGNSRQFLDYFREVSRGWWSLPSGLPVDNDHITWTKGQPLGLYPSFASFGITHGLLLLGLSNKPSYDGDFYVLGDDVVILDDDLYQSYIDALASMKCDISLSKSISSNTLCEFAGKIITSDGFFHQLKWRDISDDSFISICRLLGPQSRSLLTSRQRKVVDVISDLPVELGGFGWNPSGRSLSDRLSERWYLWNSEKLPTEPITDLRSTMNRKLLSSYSYRSGFAFFNDSSLELAEAFDQKAFCEITSVLPGFPGIYRWMGRNASYVSSRKLSLPISHHTRHRSLLETLELEFRGYGYL